MVDISVSALQCADVSLFDRGILEARKITKRDVSFYDDL